MTPGLTLRARGVPVTEPTLSRAEAKLIRGLHRRKIRETEGLFLVEGVRVSEDLLASSIDLRLGVVAPSLEDTARGRALIQRLAQRAPLRQTTDAELAALADTESPQGVLIVARTPISRLTDVELGPTALGLVLDAVQDPGNFGTLVRTADALGATFVAGLPGTVDAWNPKAVRSAAGSAFHLPIVMTSLAELGVWLRANDFTLYAADADGQPIHMIEPAPRVALIVGNEGAGLTAEVARLADVRVAVPIRGRAESLNVAVAAGIILYSLGRER